MRRSDRAGFTAIELVIVVTIIGILAATGISKYQHYTTVARRSSCLTNQDQILAAVKAVEADRGALDPNTVMRFWYNGVIDHGAKDLPLPSDVSRTNYRTWVGLVPPSWGRTYDGVGSAQNDVVLAKTQDTQVFRCPEDMRIIGPQYTGISDAEGRQQDSVQISQTYTYAKMVVTPRATTTFPAFPPDPLEGYNWMTQAIEWKSSTFVFCRRWGLRDTGVTGTGVLNSNSNDVYYVPAQERLMAHTPAVSTAR